MVFWNKYTIIQISISFLIFQINSSYIFLPFSKHQISSEEEGIKFTPEILVENYVDPKFSTIIEVGTPPQKVELILSSERFGLIMIEDQNTTSNDIFNKKLSTSINITNEFDSNFYYGRSNKPVVLNDIIFFSFYDTNLNKITKVKVEEYPFVYLTKKEGVEIYENKEFIKEENGKAYMVYGTKVYCSWKNEIGESVPNYLKHKRIINSYNFNIIFNKNQINEGLIENFDFAFLIGDELHNIYPNQYDKDNLKYTKALSYMGEINWIIEFDEVFYFPEGFKLDINNKIVDYNQISTNEEFKDKKIFYSDDFRGQMAFDLDIILCPKFYYFSINKTFFGNHTAQCQINRVKNRYSIFVCDKNFNTENFSSIYFYHKELNHTFILTEKELFKVKGDKKYFLIIYDLYRPTFWMFGKLFLEKYSFNYDMENKKIGFYKNNNNIHETDDSSNNKNFYLIHTLFWIGMTIITGIIGFFIGKKLYQSIRKKKAYELDDNYDYETNGENNGKGNKDEDLNYNKLVD